MLGWTSLKIKLFLASLILEAMQKIGVAMSSEFCQKPCEAIQITSYLVI